MKAEVSEFKIFQIWNKVQLLSCSVQFYPPWAPSALGRKGSHSLCFSRRMGLGVFDALIQKVNKNNENNNR